MSRATGQQMLDLMYEVLNPLGIKIYRNEHPATATNLTGEFITFNYIPNFRNENLSFNFFNVNVFIPKINNGDGILSNSLRIKEIENLIVSAIESFENNVTETTKINYYAMKIAQEPQVFNESESYNMLNIRVEVAFY